VEKAAWKVRVFLRPRSQKHPTNASPSARAAARPISAFFRFARTYRFLCFQQFPDVLRSAGFLASLVRSFIPDPCTRTRTRDAAAGTNLAQPEETKRRLQWGTSPKKGGIWVWPRSLQQCTSFANAASPC